MIRDLCSCRIDGATPHSESQSLSPGSRACRLTGRLCPRPTVGLLTYSRDVGRDDEIGLGATVAIPSNSSQLNGRRS